MKKLVLALTLILSAFIADAKVVNIKIMQTSDIHGNFYPYNFITRQDWQGSLARVCAAVQKEREVYGDNLLLLDNGDILQGQPSAYYYNFINTEAPHLVSEIMNYMKYDAGSVGNHDVETGRPVMERWIDQCNFPVLGANIINKETGIPFVKPYQIFERDGVKIAVFGMITPAIPAWLPEQLWKGLQFDDMEETARKWVPFILKNEKPDILVGLFHAGQAGDIIVNFKQNASREVAEHVPGFDMVLMGHDHRRECKMIKNCEGKDVLIIDPANNGNVVSNIDIKVTIDDNGIVTDKDIKADLLNVNQFEPDADFMAQFKPQFEEVKQFVGRKIGYMTESISTRPAYFGPSAFIDLIHTLQLGITKADISFAAPLSFDAKIAKGDIMMSDMFSLYKYENMLYVMELSGKEIKGYLEKSYEMWTNRMTEKNDHLLLFRDNAFKGEKSRGLLKNRSYNFDSAAGIKYTVDVTKPAGEKVNIISMADGSDFDLNKIYKVALNSYRGNGGGELLTKGAGIALEELPNRIIFSTDKDLRFYLMKYIEEIGTVEPKVLDQWKFIPEKWVKRAAKKDMNILFQ